MSTQRSAYRERLLHFYQLHNPSKMDDVDSILDSFAGQEEVMFAALEKKYATTVAGPSELLEKPVAATTTAASADTGAGTSGAVALDGQAALRASLGERTRPRMPSEAMKELEETLKDVLEVDATSLPADLSTLIRKFQLAATRMVDNARVSLGMEDNKTRFALTPGDAHYTQVQDRTRQLEGSLNAAAATDERRSSVIAVPPQDSTAMLLVDRPTQPPAPGGAAERMVVDIVPVDHASGVVSGVIAKQCRPGDVVVLHPGVYYDNIILSDGDVEIRAAIETEEGTVTLCPHNADVPVLQTVGTASLKLFGITLADPCMLPAGTVGSKRASRTPAVGAPLVALSGASKGEFRNVHCCGGSGGAVVAGAAHLTLHNCFFTKCVFAAIYVKDDAFAALLHCLTSGCEVGVRVRDTSFSMENCEIRSSSSDGVALHGPCKGIIERSTIVDNTDNGLLLSPTCEVLVSCCILRNNKQWGIYAPLGADFGVISSNVYMNGLGDLSRQPSSQSGKSPLSGQLR